MFDSEQRKENIEIITLITMLDVSGPRRCNDISSLTAKIILLLQQVAFDSSVGEFKFSKRRKLNSETTITFPWTVKEIYHFIRLLLIWFDLIFYVKLNIHVDKYVVCTITAIEMNTFNNFIANSVIIAYI